MDSTLKSRLEKIQSLMENAGTIGEAEAAAAAFQRLVMKHNLAAADLTDLGQGTDDPYVFEYIDLREVMKTGIKWRLSLLHTLSKFNFCTTVRGHYQDGTLTIIGKESNVRAVQAMFSIMVPTFQRLALESWTTYQATDPFISRRVSSRAYRKSFLLGVPSGLWDKFKAERAEEVKETPNVNALVLVLDEELEQQVNGYFNDGLVKTKARRSMVNGDGYRNGIEAGRNYSDAKPVRAGVLSLSNGS